MDLWYQKRPLQQLSHTTAPLTTFLISISVHDDGTILPPKSLRAEVTFAANFWNERHLLKPFKTLFSNAKVGYLPKTSNVDVGLDYHYSVTRKKSPNVNKSCQKWFHQKNERFWQKLPKNVGDSGKLIVAEGFKKLPKVQKLPHLVTLTVNYFRPR